MREDDFRDRWIRETADRFRALKADAERALEQVGEADFFRAPGPDSNSLAVLVKHMAGNLRSRWTNWLTTDGEKPDRARDTEFEIGPADTREALMAAWQRGWQCAFDALAALTPADLDRTVVVRTEPMRVEQAAIRQLTHAAAHVGQIVYLAKLLCGGAWRTLSIPRGESERFNREMRERFAAPGRAGG